MVSQHVLLHEGRPCDSSWLDVDSCALFFFILSYYSIPVKVKRRYYFTIFTKSNV